MRACREAESWKWSWPDGRLDSLLSRWSGPNGSSGSLKALWSSEWALISGGLINCIPVSVEQAAPSRGSVMAVFEASPAEPIACNHCRLLSIRTITFFLWGRSWPSTRSAEASGFSFTDGFWWSPSISFCFFSSDLSLECIVIGGAWSRSSASSPLSTTLHFCFSCLGFTVRHGGSGALSSKPDDMSRTSGRWFPLVPLSQVGLPDNSSDLDWVGRDSSTKMWAVSIFDTLFQYCVLECVHLGDSCRTGELGSSSSTSRISPLVLVWPSLQSWSSSVSSNSVSSTRSLRCFHVVACLEALHIHFVATRFALLKSLMKHWDGAILSLPLWCLTPIIIGAFDSMRSRETRVMQHR